MNPLKPTYRKTFAARTASPWGACASLRSRVLPRRERESGREPVLFANKHSSAVCFLCEPGSRWHVHVRRRGFSGNVYKQHSGFMKLRGWNIGRVSFSFPQDCRFPTLVSGILEQHCYLGMSKLGELPKLVDLRFGSLQSKVNRVPYTDAHTFVATDAMKEPAWIDSGRILATPEIKANLPITTDSNPDESSCNLQVFALRHYHVVA